MKNSNKQYHLNDISKNLYYLQNYNRNKQQSQCDKVDNDDDVKKKINI